MDIPNITSTVERVKIFTNIDFQISFVSLNEIGIVNVPVISDVIINNPDSLPISIFVDLDDYNIIHIERGEHPILEESISFTVTYSVITIV
jgi:hypothetical protein